MSKQFTNKNRPITRILFAAAVTAICGHMAYAQTPAATNPNSDAPLEITADETLEWHRNDLQFIARGNVQTSQGDVTITSGTQTADYRETKQSSFDIYRLIADGNVRIISGGNTASGDRATYNVDQGLAVMTGNNLMLTSPERTLTAKDQFEYYVTDGRLIAKGNAVVIQGQDRIRADEIGALLKDKTISGKREIDKLTADGHVVITTATETLKGQSGIYDADTNTARITGNVTITRGPNTLSGAEAEVNLNTNVSKMMSGSGKNSRVSGRFYPGSEDSSSNESAPTPITPAPQQQPRGEIQTQQQAPAPVQTPQSAPPSLTRPQPKGLMTRP